MVLVAGHSILIAGGGTVVGQECLMWEKSVYHIQPQCCRLPLLWIVQPTCKNTELFGIRVQMIARRIQIVLEDGL